MRATLLADTLFRDALYTLRTLSKNRVFAVTAILTLALGIGATTAIFTVIRAVLLRPLQYRDPDRVVELSRGVTPVRSIYFRRPRAPTARLVTTSAVLTM